MQRAWRFFISVVLAGLANLCFYLSFVGTLTYYSVGFSIEIAFLSWAGLLMVYLLLTLTVYLVMVQLFPHDDNAAAPPQGMTITRVGAWMLIGGTVLGILSYLNLWAADDFSAYQVCVAGGSDVCEANAAVWGVLGLRYAGWAAAGLSLPTLLVGLMVNGLEGWGG